MYIDVYRCIYIYIYIQIYIHKCICASTYRTDLPAYVRECMYMCICNIHQYIYIYILYMYIHISTHKYVYVHLQTCMNVCVYNCIYNHTYIVIYKQYMCMIVYVSQILTLYTKIESIPSSDDTCRMFLKGWQGRQKACNPQQKM